MCSQRFDLRAWNGGPNMLIIFRLARLLPTLAVLLFAWDAQAQSFRVQCPAGTDAHPATVPQGYSTKTILGRTDGLLNPTPAMANPGIKCQQISGGDGFVTMGDGTQTYLFGFGPLSGLRDIHEGLPGTQPASVFDQESPTGSGAPSDLVGMPDDSFMFNGAIGLTRDPESTPPNLLTGHVDAREIMDVGVMSASQPAPLMAIDEDDEYFLTLTNVGQIMRPDLFEQHTVHFHGYPNASAFYDGVPDASIAINVGGSFTYYYLAPEAGTYFWHCHITPPEHLQMGMVGQLYVRPRQNRVPIGGSLYNALVAQQTDPRTACNSAADILCSNPVPAVVPVSNGRAATGNYAYNDGDGSTHYDVEYPIQIHGFDPNFHFVGMTFNPEGFTDMKDKYFLLNGQSYTDTVQSGPLETNSTDGANHFSHPLPSIINIPADGKALLRNSPLDVTDYEKTDHACRTASGCTGSSGCFVRPSGACGGSWDYRAHIQSDRATGLHQPTRRSDDLLLGVRLPYRLRAERLCAERYLRCCVPHDAGSRAHTDRHRRTDGHSEADE